MAGWGQASAARKATELAALLEVPAGQFQAVLSATYDRRARGELGAPRQMLEELCRMLGCQPPPKALERAAALRVSQFREVLRSPRPEVPELFARLCAGGIAIGMISDCSGETPLIWPELVWAKPITAPVFSFEERQRKPAAELYHLAASRLGVRVGECLYVGDGGSQELSGARAAGMEAWQLLLPRQDGEPHLQYDPDPNWDGPRIRDLRQLLGPAPG